MDIKTPPQTDNPALNAWLADLVEALNVRDMEVMSLDVINTASIANIKLSGNYQFRYLGLIPLASEPDNLREGMLVCADNENWDPDSVAGSSPYLTFYDGSAWNQVS